MQTKTKIWLKSSLFHQTKHFRRFPRSFTIPHFVLSNSISNSSQILQNFTSKLDDNTFIGDTLNSSTLPLSDKEKISLAVQIDAPKIQQLVNELKPLERECLKKFAIGAMSHGSINFQAHSVLAAGTNLTAFFLKAVENPQIIPKDQNYQEAFGKFLPDVDLWNYGPKSNSGEGGELEIRDNSVTQSFIRQVASGRFGVNLRYLVHAREIQIKINQGAKPGVGGK